MARWNCSASSPSRAMSTLRCHGSPRSWQMLPHDALRMACFDQRGRPIVNASTADVPDMTASDVDELIIEDLRSGGAGRNRCPARDGAAGRCRLPLGPGSVDPAQPEPWCAWRSGRSGRWPSIARNCRSPVGSRTTSDSGHSAATLGRTTHQIDDGRTQRVDAGVQRARRSVNHGHPPAGRRRFRRMARRAA